MGILVLIWKFLTTCERFGKHERNPAKHGRGKVTLSMRKVSNEELEALVERISLLQRQAAEIRDRSLERYYDGILLTLAWLQGANYETFDIYD